MPYGWRVFARIIGLAAVVVVLDQATKWWAVAALDRGEPVALVGEFLQLRLVYNPGAAFSLGTEYTWLLTILAAVAVAVILHFAWRTRSRAWGVALGLILGGAFTHLLDRLFRQPGFAKGHVVDFIDYAGFFVGNVADIAIVVGACLAILLNLRGVQLQPKSVTAGHGKDTP